MRVGIMGGTLDPVHSGHVQIAKAAIDALGLDRMMLLPAGDPPHKTNPCIAAVKSRAKEKESQSSRRTDRSYPVAAQ